MTKLRKNLDEGIILDPTITAGDREGELWVDSNDNKLKIVLENQIKELTTTNSNTAESKSYDNSSSGLTSINVQNALAELKVLLDIINAPVITSLSITEQPTDQTIDTPISPPITIQLKDENGADITGTNTVTVTLSAGGNLSGDVSVDAIDGVATFSDLQINTAGNNYTLTFESTGLGGTTSNSFDISLALPFIKSLEVTVQPSTTEIDTIINPSIKVQLKDQYDNNIVGTNTVTVTLSAGGTLSGTLSEDADISTGIATFDNLQVNTDGNYVLFFESINLTGTPTTSFVVEDNTPVISSLSITQQPIETFQNMDILPPITVQLKDQFGVDITGTNTVTASITLPNNSSGTLSSILDPTLSVNSIGGEATFRDLQIDNAGNYSITFTSTGLTADVSDIFEIKTSIIWNTSLTTKPIVTTNSSAESQYQGVFDFSFALVQSVNEITSGDFEISFDVITSPQGNQGTINAGIDISPYSSADSVDPTSSLDFGIRIQNGGTGSPIGLHLYENVKTNSNPAVYYIEGNKLTIRVVGTTITYYQENTLLWTSSQSFSGYPVRLSAFLRNTVSADGATIPFAKIQNVIMKNI
jgi:hypothetical protein